MADLMAIIVAALDEDDAIVSHEREVPDVLMVDMADGRTLSVTIEEE